MPSIILIQQRVDKEILDAFLESSGNYVKRNGIMPHCKNFRELTSGSGIATICKFYLSTYRSLCSV